MENGRLVEMSAVQARLLYVLARNHKGFGLLITKAGSGAPGQRSHTCDIHEATACMQVVWICFCSAHVVVCLRLLIDVLA